MKLINANRILILCAHHDDFEFMFGGSAVKLYAANPRVTMRIVVFASRYQNTGETDALTRRQQSESMRILGLDKADISCRSLDYRARFLPLNADDIRLTMSEEKEFFNPDLVITHSINDENQDHVTLGVESRRVFKNVSLLHGGVVSSSRYFKPTIFCRLTYEQFQRKVDALKSYSFESSKYYFNEEVLTSHSRAIGFFLEENVLVEGFEVTNLYV